MLHKHPSGAVIAVTTITITHARLFSAACEDLDRVQ